MKLISIKSNGPRQSQHGSVVLVLLAMLVLMVMLCAATWQAVYLSRQEINLIEKHQIERLAATTTNTPAAAARSLSAP